MTITTLSDGRHSLSGGLQVASIPPMSNLFYLALYVVFGLGVAFLLLRIAIAARAYLRFKGKMLVTCPETKCPAAVNVDTTLAAEQSLLGEPHLRLRECSRWRRLRVPETLRRTLASTNLIESAFSVVETVCRNVKRRRPGD